MGECFSHSPSSEAAATAAGASSSSSKTTKSNATNMNNPNAPVVISACNKHTATLIFLHGLGDTGQGWASSLAEIRTDNTRIVCPTAPTVNVTLNPGYPMPSWFDLMSLDPNGPEDEPGIRKAVAYVEKLIDDEISQGVPSERIVLGGFSQGGALAMFTALTTKHKLGGLVALSCWFPLHKTLLSEGGTLNSDLPVLQCHGDCDPIVPYKWGQMTSTMLKKLLSKYDFKTYKSLGHSSHPLEMEDVQTFVNERIGDM